MLHPKGKIRKEKKALVPPSSAHEMGWTQLKYCFFKNPTSTTIDWAAEAEG